MFQFIVKLFVILSLVAAFGNTKVTVENGGYDVLVSFSQNVQSKDGKVLLDNMKASLEEASEILHNAIGLHFSKVTFKLPASWDISELNVAALSSSDHDISNTDFLIDGANDVVFGKLALAQQYGSCGVPGKQIIIPTAFFDQVNVFPKGTTLAREWLKYRYGVFDENGYMADPMYPLYYTTPGSDPSEVKITDCTNAQVTYNFLDQDGNNCSTLEKPLIQRLDSGECGIVPDEEENITSSMMYFQKDISTMQHICGKEPDHVHNSRSPNKQNTLCSGQSIWDIVKNSSDFQEEITAEGVVDVIQYVYVQEAKPKIVVAWENTKQISSKGQVILNAIKKFMVDLPNGSKFNGFPFKSNIQAPNKRDYTLHDLNELRDKKRIIEDISSDFVISEDGNINLAISKALEILSSATSDSEIEGTIVIITKSIQKLDEAVLERLDNSKVCVMLLLFSEGGIPEEVQSYTSTLSCATLETFQISDENKDTYEKLFRGMETLLPSTVDDKETKTIKTEYLSKESAISVEADSTVEAFTFWVFSKKESDNFNLKFNEIEENLTNVEDFGNLLAISYSPSEAGEVEFSFPHDTDEMLTHVTVTYKEGNYFNGEVFIYDTSEKDSSVQMPVIIYALINFGAYPVQNAIVLATIEGPDGNKIDLGLNDDGKGDPDITKNDGIYSRYFTSFSEKGEYTVTITVENKFATYGADRKAGYQTCCGSYVNDGTLKLPRKFSKVLKTTFTAKNGRPDDGYKPSRILDLRIDSVTDDKVVLKWTAPGSEADSGTAQSYEIKLFTSQDEALNNFDSGMSIFDYTASPKNRGETEILEIKLTNFEKEGLCFIGIKAKNLNKTSDLSNTIEILVPERKTTASPDEDKEDTDKGSKQSGVNSKTVGIVIGSIVGVIILLIIIYLAMYYAVVKPKREKEVKQKQISHDPLPPSENINPINFVSAATLIEHHKEKTKAKIENKEPRIFKEEDFENKNSLPTNESGESSSNNDQELENKNKAFPNGESLPPKSPKRTTFV